MQRKPTKNTRGPDASEKHYQNWIKTERQTCAACGNKGPVIGHHCEGATFKHNKELVGHWFFIGLCQACDDVVTHGSRRGFRELFGPQSAMWEKEQIAYLIDTERECPPGVYMAIMDWGK